MTSILEIQKQSWDTYPRKLFTEPVRVIIAQTKKYAPNLKKVELCKEPSCSQISETNHVRTSQLLKELS